MMMMMVFSSQQKMLTTLHQNDEFNLDDFKDDFESETSSLIMTLKINHLIQIMIGI